MDKLYTDYLEWTETQDPVRVLCLELSGSISIRLRMAGHALDSELMLDFIPVLFPEVTNDLVRGMIIKITSARPTSEENSYNN